MAELRAGRSLTAKRRGFKPLTDRDVKDSVEQGRLSAYAATSLELAVRQKLPLASRDEALCQAAQRCRVKLLLQPSPSTRAASSRATAAPEAIDPLSERALLGAAPCDFGLLS